ncbi:hypothetical protein J1G43_00720 [Cellulomonas sp. zg-ZUI22]|uniref:hypothetical protein n=1 Tax=Cellulomonas sp. zg-ZUI22 TaxID=2816955 RepID=UPI001A93D040|nr:hypothetical protein [Cellulomonas sp. zg-ZUI22]MBO0898488.1 hypothetical protein [Cellulomonas sp. zg-ZUI22]
MDDTTRPVADGGPDDHHLPPPGTDDATVAAVGAVTAAFEVVEHARGTLYAFHRLIGRADAELQQALDDLEAAGHGELADRVRADVVGRNVLPGRWTFQVVEEFDEGYHRAFADAERHVRDELTAGRRHVYEARLKEHGRTHGRPGHEALPADVPNDADEPGSPGPVA